jgi:hypothetical protein
MPDKKMVFHHSEKPFGDLVGMGIFGKGNHVGFIYKQDENGPPT